MLLKSRDIYLRFLRKTDAASLHAAIKENRSEFEKYVFGSTHLHSLRVDQMIERAKLQRGKRQEYFFGIFAAEDKQLVGYVNLYGISQGIRSGEVGFSVRASQTGKGIATTATALIVLFGFKELKLHKIVLRTVHNNFAAWRIAEKIGFVQDGIQCSRLRWENLRCYSMLETEFRQLRPLLTRLAKGKKD